MREDLWNFTASVGEERRPNLEANTLFDATADEIKSTMEVLCCHHDPCQTAARFGRVVYCVSVSRPLFDRFFNGRHGYRATYSKSPYEGMRVSDLLLRGLAPALLAAAATDDCPKDRAFIQESLTSPSAKAWLAEANPGLCGRCKGEWVHPAADPVEIRNGRWEIDPSRNAAWGRTAPYLTKIMLIGAHLSDEHDEFIPGRKRHRAWVHNCGWS